MADPAPPPGGIAAAAVGPVAAAVSTLRSAFSKRWRAQQAKQAPTEAPPAVAVEPSTLTVPEVVSPLRPRSCPAPPPTEDGNKVVVVTIPPPSATLPPVRRAVSFSDVLSPPALREFNEHDPPLLVNNKYQLRVLTPFLQRPRLWVEAARWLQMHSVMLERTTFQFPELSGTIVVRHISYEKEVVVRLSFDNWQSFQDIPAHWTSHIDANSGSDWREDAIMRSAAAAYSLELDRFTFSVDIGKNFVNGRQVVLCVRYRSGGQELWDNNRDLNYVATMTTETLYRQFEKEHPYYEHLGPGRWVMKNDPSEKIPRSWQTGAEGSDSEEDEAPIDPDDDEADDTPAPTDKGNGGMFRQSSPAPGGPPGAAPRRRPQFFLGEQPLGNEPVAVSASLKIASELLSAHSEPQVPVWPVAAARRPTPTGGKPSAPTKPGLSTGMPGAPPSSNAGASTSAPRLFHSLLKAYRGPTQRTEAPAAADQVDHSLPLTLGIPDGSLEVSSPLLTPDVDVWTDRWILSPHVSAEPTPEGSPVLGAVPLSPARATRPKFPTSPQMAPSAVYGRPGRSSTVPGHQRTASESVLSGVGSRNDDFNTDFIFRRSPSFDAGTATSSSFSTFSGE